MSTRARALRAGYRSGFEDDTAKYLKEKGVEFSDQDGLFLDSSFK